MNLRVMRGGHAYLTSNCHGCQTVCRLMCTKNKTHHTHVSSRKSRAHTRYTHLPPLQYWQINDQNQVKIGYVT